MLIPRRGRSIPFRIRFFASLRMTGSLEPTCVTFFCYATLAEQKHATLGLRFR
jgi:hypothetical protein